MEIGLVDVDVSVKRGKKEIAALDQGKIGGYGF